MDKFERMAVEAVAQAWCLPAHEDKPTDPELGDDLTRLVLKALRQCEADTIRRCAEELSDAAANYADSEHSDVRMLWLASKTILTLLPEE